MSMSSTNILRFNVGFLLNESIGYVREVSFETGQIHLSDDLSLTEFTGRANLTRTPLGILVNGQFQGLFQSTCTRCLTDVTGPLSIDVSELYVFPRQPDAELFISESRELDLMPLIHQEMTLAETIRVICRPDCKGLCPQCGENLNLATCNCAKDDIDPRLSILKQLLDGA